MNAPAGVLRPEEPRLKFRPKLDKIVELLLYLAHKRPNADQYQAVKFFYLADKEHFNRYGRPITFDFYYALDYGPVASTALDLIKERESVMKAAGITELPIKTDKKDNIILLAEPKRGVEYDMFSKSDLAVFDEILEKYGHMSFGDLYKLTHSHFAYDVAWTSRKGNAKRALMFYEDMLDEGPRKARLMETLEPIAEHMK